VFGTSGGLYVGIDLALHVVELISVARLPHQTVSWVGISRQPGWHQHD
jgi:hypothetical protein